jgi:cephalosporin hydroxylase
VIQKQAESGSAAASQSGGLLFSVPDRAEPLDAYSDEGFGLLTQLWTKAGWQRRLSYEVTWLGVPIIQLPEDMVMMQELLYRVRPAVVVETGVAHGGSAILYASILKLLGRGRVVGVDVEIRKYNRLAIQSHPMSELITLIEGSSIDPATFAMVRGATAGEAPIVVTLDSNHTRQHVLKELEMYGELVTPGGYVVVFDTVMDIVADAPSGNPTWVHEGAGAAVREFLKSRPDWEADPYFNRLGATHCAGGFLKRRPQGAGAKQAGGR